MKMFQPRRLQNSLHWLRPRRYINISTNPNDRLECWKCNSALQIKDLFCSAESCGVVQPIKLDQNNSMFDLFHVPANFNIDEEVLDKNFKELQRQFHPDKFVKKSLAEKEISASSSSLINTSYQTLKSPLRRAEYLIYLAFNKPGVLAESKTVQDPQLMLEMFRLREELEDMIDESHGQRLIKEVRAKISEQEREFQRAMDAKESNAAVAIVTKLSYYYKIIEELNRKMQPE